MNNRATANCPIVVVNNLNGQNLSTGSVIYNMPEITITVSLANNSVYDSIALWDFGDGTKVKGKTATHSYPVEGTYTITCTLYNSSTREPVDNSSTVTINVVRPFETYIEYTPNFVNLLKEDLQNIFAGETFIAGEFYAYLDSRITKEVPILCYSSINDIAYQTNAYPHLLPTVSFYDAGNQCNSITPKYCDVYMTFFGGSITIYVVNTQQLTYEDLENISVMNQMTGYSTYNKVFISDISDLSGLTYFYIGKIGKATVSYRSDFNAEQAKFSFVYDQRYFPTTGVINGKAVNLVSLAYAIDIKQNNINDATIFYSANGLTTNEDITKLDLENNKYSIFTAKYSSVTFPIVIRVAAQGNSVHFAKDFTIDIKENSSWSTSDNIIIDEKAINKNYAENGSIIIYARADKEIDTFDINTTVTISDGSNSRDITINIPGLKSISLDSFTDPTSQYYLDPKQKYENITGAEVWKVYKTHDMFSNVPNLDHFIEAILDNNDLMRTIINSGFNFVDNFGNINTATIKSLVSMFDYLGMTPDIFDIDNFAKPAVINKLLQIFSIPQSRLVGSTYIEPDEFESYDGTLGKNIGEKLEKYSHVYINNGWPHIIAYDKFSKKYIKVNTMVATSNVEVKSADDISDNEDTDGENCIIIDNGINGNQFFRIGQYSINWGWGLHAKTADDLFTFYDIYLYQPSNNTLYSETFLAPETISDNIKDYDTWVKDDGSIDRLLYKTFIETLDLNKS